MLRAVSSVGMRGREFIPHFLKEFKPIGSVGQEGDLIYIPGRPGFAYQHPEPKMIELQDDQWDMVIKGMWSVVNGGGTGGRIALKGFDIAGKTGTAQVTEVGKDSGAKKDHSWFVSFAPAYKPEISVIALIENSGFGASNAARLPLSKNATCATLTG
jgi:penicillin-binding protein 2